MNKTILWHVGIAEIKDKRCIVASINQLPAYLFNSHMRFKCITGKAAARRFIRGNLLDFILKYDCEYGEYDIVNKNINYLCKDYMGCVVDAVPIVVIKNL